MKRGTGGVPRQLLAGGSSGGNDRDMRDFARAFDIDRLRSLVGPTARDLALKMCLLLLIPQAANPSSTTTSSAT